MSRITNTIVVANGVTLTRPSAISAYQGSMPTVETWWPLWKDFMFNLEVNTSSREQVCARLSHPHTPVDHWVDSGRHCF